MSGVIDQAPKIIREAAKSPLGLLALVALAVAVLAFLFFHDASELVRTGIFCALLLGAGLFSAKILQIAASEHAAIPPSIARGDSKRAADTGIQASHSPKVTARLETDPPFRVDAIAVEDDTHMVLSADPAFKIAPGSLKREGQKAATSAKEQALGAVVVRSGDPATFCAIIHDLSKEPTWTEESIRQGLISIFREAENRKLKAVAIPPLGTKHGTLDHSRFIELFKTALLKYKLQSLERIWIVLPKDFSSEALKNLP